MTLSIVFAFGPVALKIFKPQVLSGTTLLIISMVCFLYYHPIAVEGRFVNSLKGNRTTEHCIDFLDKVSDRNILIIAERPGQFTAMGYRGYQLCLREQERETDTKRKLQASVSEDCSFAGN